MRFLIDRCAGHVLANWLRETGHDVLEANDLGRDPGDEELLRRAFDDDRILVTIDTDFGELVYLHDKPHRGLVRLPDAPAATRIALMRQVLTRHVDELREGAIITVRGGRVRVSRR